MFTAIFVVRSSREIGKTISKKDMVRRYGRTVQSTMAIMFVARSKERENLSGLTIPVMRVTSWTTIFQATADIDGRMVGYSKEQ